MVGSALFHGALLVLFLWVGLSYYEPKPEDGILINFGTTAEAFGQVAEPTQKTSKPQTQPEQSQEPAEESALTQDITEAPALPDQKKIKPQEKKPENAKETEPVKEPEEELEPEPEPQPSESLQKLLEKTKNSRSGGEGNTKGSGDQGKPEGDPNSNNRSGAGGGAGGDGNYLLGSRQARQKPKPNYPCADEGRVVVRIYVDRSGAVVRAIPGDKVPNGPASTTTSSCLYDQARKAAMRTTWEPDSEAAEQQAGYIIYNFKKQ